MKRSLRAVALILTLCLLTAALCACSGTAGVYASPNARRTVAKVGDEKIRYDVLYYVAMTRLDELKETYGENVLQDPARRAEYEAYVWDHLLDRDVALRSLAAEYGLDVTKGDVGDAVDADIKQIIESEYGGDTDAYVAALDEMYLTDRYLRVLIGTEEHLPSALIVAMLDAGKLDGTDATAEALIASDALLRTYHVFISRSGNGYDEATNRAHAEEIRAEVAAGATPEERLAAMRAAIGGPYNGDYSDTTGSGLYFAVGEFDAAYESAALALDENCGVSEVLETTAGFYVILRCPKDADYIRAHFQNLKEKFYFIRLNEMVEERLAALTLEKTSLGRRLDLADLTPVRAGGGRGTIIVIAAVATVIAIALITIAVARWRKKRAEEREARRPVHPKKRRRK